MKRVPNVAVVINYIFLHMYINVVESVFLNTALWKSTFYCKSKDTVLNKVADDDGDNDYDIMMLLLIVMVVIVMMMMKLYLCFTHFPGIGKVMEALPDDKVTEGLRQLCHPQTIALNQVSSPFLLDIENTLECFLLSHIKSKLTVALIPRTADII